VYEHPCCVPGALRVCVCDVCVREVCWGGVDVGRWLPGVPALVTVPMRGWKKREREREREREKQTDREFEDHSGSAWLQHSRGGKWRDQQSLDVGHGACLPMIMFITAEHSR
jgi:hypothetical protein